MTAPLGLFLTSIGPFYPRLILLRSTSRNGVVVFFMVSVQIIPGLWFLDGSRKSFVVYNIYKLIFVDTVVDCTHGLLRFIARALGLMPTNQSTAYK